ncbi:MAG: hypothetical protein Q9163_006261, partial [Psora crenata]
MAESATTTLAEPSPLTGPSSFGSAFDAQGLATVHEVPRQKASYDFHTPADHHSINRRSGSRDASLNSSMTRSYNEKEGEKEDRRGQYTTPGALPSEVLLRSDAHSGKLRKGDRRNTTSVNAYLEPTLAMKKPKRGGLRNTFRRMFGRIPKNRISMPAPTVDQQHNHITSATDVHRERSTSAPSDAFPRSNGLTSHPPSQPPSAPYRPSDPPALPTALELHAPERPARPRRASVSSITLNKDQVQAVTDAVAGLGLQTGVECDVDTRNIGFAITN